MAKITFEDPLVTEKSEELRAQWQELRWQDAPLQEQQLVAQELMKLRGWDWEEAVCFLAED